MGDRHFLSAREIGFVSQKRRGRLSAFLFWRLSKAHTWTASVLVDEPHDRGLQVFGAQKSHRTYKS